MTRVRLFNPTGLAVAVAVLAVWQLLVSTRVLAINYLPSPIQIAGAFGELEGVGGALAHTLMVALVAFVIALVAGLVVGLALGLLEPVRVFGLASLDVLRTLPVVALMPVALLIWGPSEQTEIIVASYSAAWPVVVNVAGGVRTIHPQLREVARTLRLSRRDELLKVIVPAVVPSLLVGARLALTSALVIAIVAEMLVNPNGLGWSLVQAQSALQPAQMWAYVIIIGIIGLLANALMVAIVNRFVPGGDRRSGGES
ncbi:ABC transporter permease [Pseudonocardia dioxanivorans]|jgi:NitT/TauT family transport system permease protein/sulfonate transport system permease protein|uniref:ABC transporter permease n=1 Tax=Pseudonocardia dioxanivorans TaxID=240495 RepID=UPI000CD1C5C5|nr:ABC transporter permease subunit [Pseudonocardia dioxanivorans]